MRPGFRLHLWLLLLLVVPARAAHAQTLTTYTTLADFNAGLPASGYVSKLETFSSVTSGYAVSQGVPDSWSGFTLVATGSSPWGTSSYCTSLAACVNWTAATPALPGIYGSFSDPAGGDGKLTFTPTGKAFAFGVDHWDWNDTGQRSYLTVNLSNGASFSVTGPTTNPGDPGGFVGFRIDTASIYAGITISSVVWHGFSGTSEIVGLRNVRIAEAVPVISVTKTSQVFDPTASNLKAIPGNEVIYQIGITNTGLAATDANSLWVLDSLPSNLAFWNGDIDSGGPDVYPVVSPVGFSQGNGAAMSFSAASDVKVGFAGGAPASFAACSSLAMDSSFRADVRYICIRPSGQLAAGASSPQITVKLRARIQ